jgi:pyruvate dehydrogenase E2 component (dihydrolipoamide acetyltransferase)
MANEFTLPSLGEGVKAGDVLTVLVKAGDTVEQEQAVIELETDKATVEVPSSVSGTIEEVKVAAGDTISVGQVIFTFASTGGAPAASDDVDRASADAVNDQDEGLDDEAPSPEHDAGTDAEEAAPEADAEPAGSQGAPAGGGGRVDVPLPSLGEGVTGADVLSVLVKVGGVGRLRGRASGLL